MTPVGWSVFNNFTEPVDQSFSDDEDENMDSPDSEINCHENDGDKNEADESDDNRNGNKEQQGSDRCGEQ